MLGAGTLLLGPPAALATALLAWVKGLRGPITIAALASSAIEALVLAVAIALSVI